MSELKKIRLLEPNMPVKATGVFKGEASGFLNWNTIPYPKFYDIYKQLLANFWIPDEVSMVSDVRSWDDLSDDIQHAFLEVITVISGLDSVQTPLMFEVHHYLKDPAAKAIVANIAQQEVIHNQSYSYVLSSIVNLSTQEKIFNRMKNHPMVLKRNEPIMEAYQNFADNKNVENLFKAFVHSTNLEGIFFYCAFAFFYALNRKGLMGGTATMINYIQRDEMVHYDFVATLISAMMTEYPELNTEENVQYIYDAVAGAVEVEKEWSKYLLEDLQDELDVDLDEFAEYIEYIANKRLRMLGLDNLYPDRENVMPWIRTYDDTSINKTKSDFFEQKSRSYAKVDSGNGFDEL